VITAARLRRACLELPGAGEDFPFGEGVSVFKVGGKMFALSRLGERPLRVSLKCEPELAAQLRATYPAVRPGYHLNKRHWNTVEIDGSMSDRLLLDLIEDSYDLVVDGLPKRTQAALGWPPQPESKPSAAATRGSASESAVSEAPSIGRSGK
jgi:predicted DNA-binding protein (MmcQ/YjbR family)